MEFRRLVLRRPAEGEAVLGPVSAAGEIGKVVGSYADPRGNGCGKYVINRKE